MVDSFFQPEGPPGSAWLRRNWNELRWLEFQWVAASDEGVVAYAPELEVVIALVVSDRVQDRVTYAFVEEFLGELQ